MKRILPTALLLLVLLPLSAFAQKIGPQQIPALEIFVKVEFQQPQLAVVLIREYALSSSAKEKDMQRQVSRLGKLAEDKKLLQKRYGLKGVTVIHELLKKERDYITAEYLIGKEVKDKAKFLEDLYSALFDTRAIVSIKDGDISLQFAMTSRSVMQQNGKGSFQRGNDALVIWPADTNSFELLLAPIGIDKEKIHSLGPFLSNNTGSPSVINEAGTNDELQHDYDIAKLNDLIVITNYIEQYHQKTGHYPLQGKTALPNYSIIATKAQQQTVPEVNFPHEVTDVKTLLSELQAVLGNDIILPFDPQQHPVNKPNIYIYRIEGDVWHVSAHLYEAYPFTAALGDHNHILEITNSEQREFGQWLAAELLAEESFQKASGRTPHQPGYIDGMRAGMGGNDAF